MTTMQASLDNLAKIEAEMNRLYCTTNVFLSFGENGVIAVMAGIDTKEGETSIIANALAYRMRYSVLGRDADGTVRIAPHSSSRSGQGQR